MPYLWMIHHDETRWVQMRAAQNSQIVQECDDFAPRLVKSGHFRGGSRRQPTAMATTLREKGGKRVITDGPRAETQEQLAGSLVVECQDLDEAISIAARFPSIRVGSSIEVRPVIPPC
jgi:hypothetical protein